MSIRPRNFSTLMLLGALTLGAGAALFGTTSAFAGDDGAGPCLAKTFKFAEVKAACGKGGKKAAKAVMKELEKKVKAHGGESKCKTCHEDTETYKSDDNAHALYTKAKACSAKSDPKACEGWNN